MNNIVLDRSLALELYRGLRKDFKSILLIYTKADCWGYQLICWLSRYFGATLTYHLVSTNQGSPSERLEHRKAVIRLILMTAKDYWLMEKKAGEPAISFKRRLGALFLTHVLYNNQPSPPEYRVKIQMDDTDIKALNHFDKELRMYMHLTDFDVGGYNFFEACFMVSRKIRTEAIEICAMACEYGLYDELPRVRQEPELYMLPIRDFVMTYFKLHEYIKMLEFEGKNQAIAYDYKVRLSRLPEEPQQEPFIEVVEDLILRQHEWQQPEGRVVLTRKIIEIFGTSEADATTLSLYLLKVVHSRRYEGANSFYSVLAAAEAKIAPAEYTWEPRTPERDFFKRDGQCNLEKFCARFGLSMEDLGVDEIQFLDELRAAPTQLILPLPKPPAGAKLERIKVAVALDHTYSGLSKNYK